MLSWCSVRARNGDTGVGKVPPFVFFAVSTAVLVVCPAKMNGPPDQQVGEDEKKSEDC